MLPDDLGTLMPARHRVGYIGWLGHGNLGDEAMYAAIRRDLTGLRLVRYESSPATRRLERLRGRRGLLKSVMLGGGTLINTPIWLETLEQGLARYGHAIMFGAGVRNPAFWDREPDNPDMLPRWAELLSTVRIRTVRGPHSRRLLLDAGLDDVEVVGDPALGLADASVAPKTGRRRIALNFGRSAGRIWGGDEEAVADWAVRLIDRLVEQGWHCTLFPVWREDVAYVQGIARRCAAEVPVFRRFLDVRSVLGLLRDCDVVIGEKLHAVVLAHCTYTPAIMLEYRPKCADYMASMDQTSMCLRTDRLDLDVVEGMLDALVADLQGIQARLWRRIRAYRERQKDVCRRLVQEVSERPYPTVPSTTDGIRSA